MRLRLICIYHNLKIIITNFSSLIKILQFLFSTFKISQLLNKFSKPGFECKNVSFDSVSQDWVELRDRDVVHVDDAVQVNWDDVVGLDVFQVTSVTTLKYNKNTFTCRILCSVPFYHSFYAFFATFMDISNYKK